MDHGTRTPRSAEPDTRGPAAAARTSSHRKEGSRSDRSRRSTRPSRADGSGRGGGSARRTALTGWPLLTAVLVVQALLSLRLVRADTAFKDEAAYLWAGHLEWAHWLHGAAIPPFAAYFSGAPVIYPPVGALADSVGGLTAARILSLLFMLGATALLWASTSRLFGRRAAFFAAALFAVLGPTLHLGVFATYDAMAVLLFALAAWLVIRAGDRRDATGWMLAAGTALALANATSYSTVLLDPVLLLLALLIAIPRPGGKLAAARCLILLAVVAVLLTAALLIGGSTYLHGFEATTLDRVPGTDAVATVLGDPLTWIGIIVVAALCGVVFSLLDRPGGTRTWLLALLTVAALLAPLEQAAVHTLASLNKHVEVGGWLAAIAAGYAVDRLIAAGPSGARRTVTSVACVIALAFPVLVGLRQSHAFATAWPNSSAFTTILGAELRHTSGRLLVEDPSLAEYYLPAGRDWQRWSSTRNIVLPSGQSTGGPSTAAGVVGPGDPAAFARFIAEGYFSLVALNFADTTALDHQIAADLEHDSYYGRPVQVVPYGVSADGQPAGTYVIWRYEPHL